MSKRQKETAASGDDHAQFFEALRADTKRLLKLGDALSPSQQTRVDRCASLRLALDRWQSAQLAGQEIDMRSFIAASCELEKLLGGSPSAPTSRLANGDARERLRRLIEATVLAPAAADPGEVERTAELMRREEMAAVIAAGGDVEPAASEPAIVAPPSPPPERPPNVVPLHYLKVNQREPWERYYDGATVPPWPLPR